MLSAAEAMVPMLRRAERNGVMVDVVSDVMFWAGGEKGSGIFVGKIENSMNSYARTPATKNQKMRSRIQHAPPAQRKQHARSVENTNIHSGDENNESSLGKPSQLLTKI